MTQSNQIGIGGHSYDSETLDLLQRVLDGAWAALSPNQQSVLPRSQLAERLLKAAADGERDPVLLRTCALQGVEPEAPLSPR